MKPKSSGHIRSLCFKSMALRKCSWRLPELLAFPIYPIRYARKVMTLRSALTISRVMMLNPPNLQTKWPLSQSLPVRNASSSLNSGRNSPQKSISMPSPNTQKPNYWRIKWSLMIWTRITRTNTSSPQLGTKNSLSTFRSYTARSRSTFSILIESTSPKATKRTPTSST